MDSAGLSRLLRPLRLGLAMLLRRAIVRLSDSAAPLQLLQVEAHAGHLDDGAEHFEGYGLTARPHRGAEALAAALGGNTSHTVVLAVADRRYRLRGLQEGEVALYDDLDQVVYLTRTGVRIASPLGVTIDTPTTRFTGDVQIGGAATVAGDLTAAGVSTAHHTHPGDSGGTTGEPNQP